jgi:hypothetical protein
MVELPCTSSPREGSEQESVRVRDLRGFLKSEVFALGQWSTATFVENGRNPTLRYGNDETTRWRIRCDSKRDPPTLIHGAWKPAHNAGFHIFTAKTATGSFSAMKRNLAKIVGLSRFLHRTQKKKSRAGRRLRRLRFQYANSNRASHRNRSDAANKSTMMLNPPAMTTTLALPLQPML